MEYKIPVPDRCIARRGDSGLKFFCTGEIQLENPRYAYVHDWYHPLPNQIGMGLPGSGMLLESRLREMSREHIGIHAAAVDDYGGIASWHLRESTARGASLEGAHDKWQAVVNESLEKVTLYNESKVLSLQRKSIHSWEIDSSDG